MSASKRLTLTVAVVLASLVFLADSAVVAQNATLRGSVTDAETGEGLPGANVVVIGANVQTGAATSASGGYQVSNLPPGVYLVTVSYIGYEKQSMSNVVLTAGESRSLNFSLTSVGIELNPISISASRRPEKSLEAPASISVLEAREITQMVAPSSAAILKDVPGVDMATTGVDRREIVMRGFNNAFSGAAYILTDYRRAAVPSLDVNIHSIMPNMAIDLEKVEIVRGPGSALYGAGVDAGVIHYLTKDPFSHPGTTISISGGERSSIAGHFRHAGTFSEKAGYKITGQYAKADDWDYNVRDELDAAQVINPVTGDTTIFNRDYEKINVNASLEFKVGDDATLIFNGGHSELKATILSGIGTVGADGYGYSYGQARLQAGSFFAQAYLNKNKGGDSFVYGQQQASGRSLAVVDNSIVLNLQAQYDLELAEGKEQLIFGVDYDRTSPDTEGTIYGRNDDNDLISEFGLYAQSLTALSPQVDLTVALRGDHNNIEDDFQLSPRAALVFKPTPEHSLRATYNRAYALPGGNSLFLDIVARRIDLAPGIAITARGRGSKDGFTFNTATAAGGFLASGLLPVPGIFGQNVFQYADAGVPTQNVPLAAVYGILHAQLAAIPTAQLQAILAANGIALDQPTIMFLIDQLSPANTPVTGLGTSILSAAPEEVKPIKPTITQTFEVGYKGLLNDRVLLAVDGYYTKKKNFISAVTRVTPVSVFTDIAGELTPAVAAGIANNPVLSIGLQQLGLSPQAVAGLLVGLAREDLEALPVGVVQHDQEPVPGEILSAYRNFGNIDFWGIDASVQILASDRLTVFGNFSYVSDDFFDNNDLEETNAALFIALNAAKLKAKGGFSYSVPNGFSFNASGRYTKAFPVFSGPYIGGVPTPDAILASLDLEDRGGLKNYFLLDIGAGYDLGRTAPGLRVDFTIQNVLDNEHREFIGAPQIGRLALARLTYSIR